MAHTVIRTDLMSGTDVCADLVSLRVYDSETVASANPIAVDNGTIVELHALEDGQREVYFATLATASSDISECAIVATPEVMYDPLKKNLDEFENGAGAICRGYIPRSRNVFSVTKEGFVGGTAPSAVGASVGLGANGKINASGSGLGTVIAIETAGRYTYYAIRLANVEA